MCKCCTWVWLIICIVDTDSADRYSLICNPLQLLSKFSVGLNATPIALVHSLARFFVCCHGCWRCGCCSHHWVRRNISKSIQSSVITRVLLCDFIIFIAKWQRLTSSTALYSIWVAKKRVNKEKNQHKEITHRFTIWRPYVVCICRVIHIY